MEEDHFSDFILRLMVMFFWSWDAHQWNKYKHSTNLYYIVPEKNLLLECIKYFKLISNSVKVSSVEFGFNAYISKRWLLWLRPARRKEPSS